MDAEKFKQEAYRKRYPYGGAPAFSQLEFNAGWDAAMSLLARERLEARLEGAYAVDGIFRHAHQDCDLCSAETDRRDRLIEGYERELAALDRKGGG